MDELNHKISSQVKAVVAVKYKIKRATYKRGYIWFRKGNMMMMTIVRNESKFYGVIY